MRNAFVFFLLFSAAVIEIHGSAIFKDADDSKTAAKKAVTDKQEQVKKSIKETETNFINKAREEIKPDLIQNYKKKGETMKKSIESNLDNEGVTALKLAIERNKPLSAYECVINVFVDGKKDIEKTLTDYQKKLDESLKKRKEDLDNAKLLTELIILGLDRTVKDSLKNIDAAKTDKDIKTHQDLGMKKCENAENQNKNLQKRIMDLKNLESSYIDEEKAMINKYNALTKTLATKLQNCVK